MNSYNLADPIFRCSEDYPDSPAIVFNGQVCSYKELATRGSQIAKYLKQSPNWTIEINTTPRVGILASRNIDACVGLIGACWAGATYIPINPKLPADRILTIFSMCTLTALIVDDEGVKLLTEQVLKNCPNTIIYSGKNSEFKNTYSSIRAASINTLPDDQIIVPPTPMSKDKVAYIIFTSGTTGTPKGVMVSVGSARQYISTIKERLDLKESDKVLETCEFSFDFSVHNMFSTWKAGASLHILPATMLMNAVKFVQNSELTVWNSVPSLAGMLSQMKILQPKSLQNLRVTVFGGEQLPESTVVSWKAAAPNSKIFNLYGPTEATVFCMSQEIKESIPVTEGRHVVSIGCALPHNEAAILDEQGQRLGNNMQGELAIAGSQLADGYLGMERLTEERFPVIDGKRWYLTGDLAFKDLSGNFHCLGRIDNQIKINGYRIELEEVDAHLRVVCGVDMVCSVALLQADGTAKGIVSFVAHEADEDRIIAALKVKLPSYMVPNQIISLKEMPCNPSGKVNRHALRQILEYRNI
jgi:amino acid adenylation domain-containing protein